MSVNSSMQLVVTSWAHHYIGKAVQLGAERERGGRLRRIESAADFEISADTLARSDHFFRISFILPLAPPALISFHRPSN
jgi:hypothetical protein